MTCQEFVEKSKNKTGTANLSIVKRSNEIGFELMKIDSQTGSEKPNFTFTVFTTLASIGRTGFLN